MPRVTRELLVSDWPGIDARLKTEPASVVRNGLFVTLTAGAHLFYCRGETIDAVHELIAEDAIENLLINFESEIGESRGRGRKGSEWGAVAEAVCALG